ncbi:MAG: hypothetical protein HS126_23060 [Anaerolineales bacterium]|nr:hypothetical protein [Anaerolineales bacterium]
MRLVQFKTIDGARQVGLVDEAESSLQVLQNVTRIYDLALEADRLGVKMERLVNERLSGETVAYEQVTAENRLLPPLDHPDPAHCYITGTGLNHLGSAQVRDAMHAKLAGDPNTLTDSMRMFKLGLEGGKPESGQVGVSPEWFYKGDGDSIVPPGQPLELPPFALDGGEEAEIVGLYVIAPSGSVLRVGFALGNEFSDHILERQNYLYLAHSKLRNCSIGPELLLGELPASIAGTVRVLRQGEIIWSDTFLTGEANMSHNLANLEHHHFKYKAFRRPGDVHCHFFGAATLSFSAGVALELGDVFEISAPPFGRPLRNPLAASQAEAGLITIRAL